MMIVWMSMKLWGICLFSCVSLTLCTGPRLPVPEVEVSLDLPPEQRFTKVIQQFNVSIWKAYASLKPKFIVNGIASKLSRARGPENDEFQAELEGIAKLTGVPFDDIHAVQMLYELNTLMVPIVNLTWPWDAHYDAADLLTSRDTFSITDFPLHFGCTGIVAKDSRDGTVYHARNLDFSLPEYLQPLTFVGLFTKGGKEVYRAQMIAGYPSVLTGMRKGSNGYAIEINTRFIDHRGGDKEVFHNLFSEKRDLSGWVKRKVLEDIDNYEGAVEAFSTRKYAATEYNIISGVKKGTILARNPDGLAYQLPLNQSEKGYIIMTNFDYIWHDIRERFDPTSAAGFGKSRRKAAQAILDKVDTITPELLFNVLNDPVVMAKDTLFQSIMNVETGLWNASLPACVSCGRSISDVLVI